MTQPVLSVRFETADEFLSSYETEVANGGLLVRGQAAGLSTGASCLVRVEVETQPAVEVPARVAAVARFGVSVIFDARPTPVEHLALRLRAGGARPTPLAVSRLRPPAPTPPSTRPALVTPAHGMAVGSAAVTAPALAKPSFDGAPRLRPVSGVSPPQPPPPVPELYRSHSASPAASTKPSMPKPVLNAQTPVASAQEMRPVARPAAEGTLQDRLAAMTPGQKMSAALSGDREVRIALLRDVNKTVHPYVLRNPRIGLDEVQWAAKMTTVSPDALKFICEHKEWGVNPTVVAALIRNARTPVSIAMRLLPKVSTSELRAIAKGGARDQVVQAARKMLAG